MFYINFLQILHKYKLVLNLKAYQAKLEKPSIYWTWQKKKNAIIILQFTQISIGTSAIVMNSEKSKTSDPYRLGLNLIHKINLQRDAKWATLSESSV